MASFLSLANSLPLLRRSVPTLKIATATTNNKSRRTRTRNTNYPISRVCACHRGLKDEDKRTIRVSDPLANDPGLSLLLSDPVLRGPSSSPISLREGGDDKQEYYLNMGYAIRTLREEFPDIFYKEPTFDIYRDDIVFKDPLNTFIGTDNYRRIYSALRFIGRILFMALWIDIVSVWQPVENVVMIRWIVHGIPRLPWETRGRFDGISEYKLDSKGKIFEHRVDNIAPNPQTKFQVLSVDELIQSLGCPSTPNPTYFESSFMVAVSSMPLLLGVTCAAYYLALHLILALRCTAEG